MTQIGFRGLRLGLAVLALAVPLAGCWPEEEDAKVAPRPVRVVIVEESAGGIAHVGTR